MSIKTLFFGPQENDWQGHASCILNSFNFQQILSQSQKIDCHSSWQDIGFENIPIIFDAADTIDFAYFGDPSQHNLSSYELGRLCNESMRHWSKIKNPPSFLSDPIVVDAIDAVPRTADPMIWAVGCAVTKSMSMSEHLYWPSVLSDTLGRPILTVTRSRSSLLWAADKILRQDIRSGDLVIWGMTTLYHKIEASSGAWDQIPVKKQSLSDIDPMFRDWISPYLDSHDLVVKNMRAILQVMAVLEKLNVNLLLVNLLDVTWLSKLLEHHENFLDLTDTQGFAGTDSKYIDLADNTIHPGPKMHAYYAESIHQRLRVLGWI